MAKKSFPPIKVLAVDDKPPNLVALSAVLDEAEYQLLEAHSGLAALELLKQHPDVALILLDVQMPGMDGFEVARRIKQMAGFEEIPIIFITAICTEDPFVRQGYEVGAIDFFSKPFDPDVLRRKVKVYSSLQHKSNLLRERERQLRESEDLVRTARQHSVVLESLTVGVIISDLEGRICQANEAVLKILKSVDEVKNDSYGEFLQWWDGEGQLLKSDSGPLLLALRKGKVSHNEVIQIRCLDHSEKAITTSASPMRGRDGAIIGAVVVMRDITEHRKMDEDIERRILRLVAPSNDRPVLVTEKG